VRPECLSDPTGAPQSNDSGVDVSFQTRAIAVRHVLHQFGDVEALQAPLDRLSNLEEGLTRAYGEEDPIKLGPRRLCGDFHCFIRAFHLYVPLLEFQFGFRIAFRLVQAITAAANLA
jgi:hypothetical protein